METQSKIFFRICTYEEAAEFVSKYERFWVASQTAGENLRRCECFSLGKCFLIANTNSDDESQFKEIDRDSIEDILNQARLKHLVPGFVIERKKSTTIKGICLFCRECRPVSLSSVFVLEKGVFFAQTSHGACIACGTCVDVCCFGAREIEQDELVDAEEKCYGCGLCVDVCPMHCVRMISRF